MTKIIGLILLIFILNSVANAQNGAFLEFDRNLQRAAETKWNNAGFSNTRIRMVTPSTNFDVKTPLNLLVLDEADWNGQSWSTEDVIHELRIAEKIYSQCEVSFGPITMIQTRSGFDSFGLATDHNFPLETKLYKAELLKSSYTHPTATFKFDGGSYAWLWSSILQFVRHGGTGWEVLQGTASISYRDTLKYRANPPPHKEYNILAHELAHVLWNSEHLDYLHETEPATFDNNILCGAWSCKGTQITPAQCADLRERLSKNH